MTISEAKKIIEKHGESMPSEDQIAAELEFLNMLISCVDVSKLSRVTGLRENEKSYTLLSGVL